jgi:hypothetical protein
MNKVQIADSGNNKRLKCTRREALYDAGSEKEVIRAGGGFADCAPNDGKKATDEEDPSLAVFA